MSVIFQHHIQREKKMNIGKKSQHKRLVGQKTALNADWFGLCRAHEYACALTKPCKFNVISNHTLKNTRKI